MSEVVDTNAKFRSWLIDRPPLLSKAILILTIILSLRAMNNIFHLHHSFTDVTTQYWNFYGSGANIHCWTSSLSERLKIVNEHFLPVPNEHLTFKIVGTLRLVNMSLVWRWALFWFQMCIFLQTGMSLNNIIIWKRQTAYVQCSLSGTFACESTVVTCKGYL